MWGFLPFSPPFIPYISSHTPNTKKHLKLPYTTISVAPSLVSKHIYLCSLTFLLDLMKWPQYGGSESLSLINVNNCFVSATRG